MIRKTSVHLLLLLAVINGSSALARPRLPAFFCDNMILQQQASDGFWGWASPRARVSIRTGWSAKLYTVLAGADGSWKIRIPAPAAGGPYRIAIDDGEATITLKNVLVGEVWLCSGQSNMEMPLQGYPNQPVNGSNQEILDAGNPSIRLFTAEKKMSHTRRTDCVGSWAGCSPQTAAPFSAAAYFFGKHLYERLHVPIGLIDASWGGTAIEAWMGRETLQQFPFVDLSTADTATNPSTTPSLLFNGMIAPFAGYGIKGFIWYQGESNRFHPDEYLQLFPAMIREWRTEWAMGDLSFYYVQIAPYYYWDEKNNSAYQREAQLKTMQVVSNTGMVSTLDIGGEFSIHPPEKGAVGKRLALYALSQAYGQKGFAFSGPVYKNMRISGKKAELFFEQADLGFDTLGRRLADFEMAGRDSIFHPARARVTDNKTIVVFCDSVDHPLAVRYAWRNWVIGSLFNVQGLPASSFRTDNWQEK